MATIAEMAVNLVAKTNKFDAPVDKSRKTYKRLTKDLDKSESTFRKLATSVDGLGISLTGLVSTAAIAGAYQMVSATMEQVDALGKQAFTLGLSTSALDKYNFAAKRAGVEQTKVNDAIRTMAVRLGEAQTNAGTADALRSLGLNLDTLFKLKPGDQFRTIGEGLSHLTNQNAKLFAFSKVFGEEAGPAMMRMFAGGNVATAARDLKHLGGALTEEDAQTAAKFADAAGDLSVAMERLKISLAGVAGNEMVKSLTATAKLIGAIAKHPALKGVLKQLGSVSPAGLYERYKFVTGTVRAANQANQMNAANLSPLLTGSINRRQAERLGQQINPRTFQTQRQIEMHTRRMAEHMRRMADNQARPSPTHTTKLEASNLGEM